MQEAEQQLLSFICFKFQTYWNSIKLCCQTIIDAKSVILHFGHYLSEHSKLPEETAFKN